MAPVGHLGFVFGNMNKSPKRGWYIVEYGIAYEIRVTYRLAYAYNLVKIQLSH